MIHVPAEAERNTKSAAAGMYKIILKALTLRQGFTIILSVLRQLIHLKHKKGGRYDRIGLSGPPAAV
jgi:hypothetical protein